MQLPEQLLGFAFASAVTWYLLVRLDATMDKLATRVDALADRILTCPVHSNEPSAGQAPKPASGSP